MFIGQLLRRNNILMLQLVPLIVKAFLKFATVYVNAMAAYCFTLRCAASVVPENMSFTREIFVCQYITLK